MICPLCNNETEDSKFCQFCGRPIPREIPVEEPA